MAFECMFGRVSTKIIYTNLYRDHTLESLDKKSETTFCQSRSKSNEMRSQEAGPLRLLILSIKYYCHYWDLIDDLKETYE